MYAFIHISFLSIIRIFALLPIKCYKCIVFLTQRNNLIALFRNADEDSELRLAAYLQVMKCPNDIILQQIKQTLLSEEVNQVSYISEYWYM